MFGINRFRRKISWSAIHTSIKTNKKTNQKYNIMITLYESRTFPTGVLCPFSPFSFSPRGHKPTQPVYISSVAEAIRSNFPTPNTPSGHYQWNDLLSFPPSLFFPWCDLNIDNPSLNKYTHRHPQPNTRTCECLFYTLQIPFIHAGMEDNPPERNIKALEAEAQECSSR